MWCSSCGQEVPGIPGAAGGPLCCGRCRTPFRAPASTQPEEAAVTTTMSSATDDQIDFAAVPQDEAAAPFSPPESGLNETPSDDGEASWDPNCLFEDWDELESQLKRTRQLLSGRGVSAEEGGRANVSPIDLEKLAKTKREPSAPPAASSGWLSALAIGLGLTGLVCGVVLIGWSWFESRGELLPIGLPIAVVSQALLILGLLGRLGRINTASRSALEQLQQLDEQLEDVRRAATTHGPAWQSASHAFYSHLADGAAPQMLLADLKSQLDLLAIKLSERS